MANHSRPIVLSPSDRRELQRSSSVPSGVSRHAQEVWLIADHSPGANAARRAAHTTVQVSRTRLGRFA